MNWAVLPEERSSNFINYSLGKREYDHRLFDHYSKILSKLPNKRVAIDIGASYGFVTKYLSERFDKVYSAEVVPEIRECLAVNVNHQNMNNVEILNHGFSDKDGNLKIYFNPAWSGHSSVIKSELHDSAQYLSCVVKPIDSCAYENVDYIKIDVEGHELEVLRGATKTIEKCKPMISIEVLSDNPDQLTKSYNVHMFLKSLNYRYVFTAIHDFFYIPE